MDIYYVFRFSGKALEFARLDIFSRVQCQSSTKVMMTITDGYSSDIVTPVGTELRDMGVIMLAIGYGPETPLMRYTLESISSEPKDQFTFIIGYDQLIEKTQQIVKKACTGNYNLILLTLLTLACPTCTNELHCSTCVS